jgi:hypothetical protein
MRFRAVVALFGLSSAFGLSAQTGTFWTSTTPRKEVSTSEVRIQPDAYRMVAHSAEQLVTFFGADVVGVHEVDLPHPSGGTERVRYWPNSVMHPELAARYPSIRTFSGESLDRPGVMVRLDLTPHGFHAMVMDEANGWWFIDPYVHGDLERSVVYRKSDYRRRSSMGPMSCGYDEVNDMEAADRMSREWMHTMGDARVGDCQLRTYRLALSCTAEYANFHGSNATMNRVNAQFERDATLTMVLVPNTDALIFLTAATDPFSNGNGSAMLGENQTICDNVIGSANYDIGHVFSTGGGGVAYLNSPCNNSLKAGGVTGQPSPINDPFDIDYVAHEMGHQYGGRHTQNNNCNRSAAAAFEPGSASTIMGYAGICSPNVQNNSDAYFHGYSMQEMAANITVGTSSTCPVVTASGNAIPDVDAGPDRTIPRSTPFLLTASGTDINATNVLSYCWEQMDNQVSTQPPVATSTNGPNFRSFNPSAGPQRYVPALPAVVAGTPTTWEVLSSVARTYNFRVTVRDNVSGAGCNDQDNMVVNVSGTAGPFLVTVPNTNVSWSASSSRTITWDVAGTNTAPVNTALVDILLSVDGGLTYPFTLATATPNDGSHSVLIPSGAATTTARVMVRANGNIFYDISNVNFTITPASIPDYTITVVDPVSTVCSPQDAMYMIGTTAILGYAQSIDLSVSGLPPGLTATIVPAAILPGASATLTISGTGSLPPGDVPFTLQAVSASGNRSVPLELRIRSTPAQVALTLPLPGATGVAPGSTLSWGAVTSADSYTVTIATDAALLNVVESATGITGTTFAPVLATAPSTTYHWAVRAIGTCGNGQLSGVRSFTTSACHPVEVRVIIDRYGNETTWQLVQGSVVVASGGPYAQLPANGTQAQPTIPLCLPAGCYELRVFDSFGDGNCCAYGAGSVQVVELPSIVLANVSQDIEIGAPAVVPFCVPTGLSLVSSVWLDGAYSSATGNMRDDLRVAGLIPAQEPYTGLGMVQIGGGGETVQAGVFAVEGSNAIVDWVRLELRQDNDPSVIVATRQALLQRDGDIVDVDGVSPVTFPVAPGVHRLVVRHRNHFGCMTLTSLSVVGNTATIDLRAAATATFGNGARRIAGASAFMWSGNVLVDDLLKYTGVDNDRDPILQTVGGTVPTATTTGYLQADVNLDGVVKYSGVNNDRDPILSNIGGSVPTSTLQEQVP